MRPLVATYRLQFRDGFGLDDAVEILPYLRRLGVSHVYASPLTRATSGSAHGYDVCAFDEIDPAIGGGEAFARFVEALHGHDMGLLLDFVPNHMAATVENPWWRSVLELGEDSPFAAFFDIDWQARAGATPGKVLVPVLGDLYEQVLERGELSVGFDAELGAPEVRYFEKRFPLAPQSWPLLFRETDAGALAERAAAGDGEAQAAVEAAIGEVNGVSQRLHELLEAQNYRLAHWRTATFSLNYRRFFDINELVGLRVDRPQVFEAVHSFVLSLIAEGAVDGLRLDHVDGLRDPAGYMRRLGEVTRAAAGRDDFPLYVEKILGPGEEPRRDWSMSGTTGYEVLNHINGLFVDGDNEAPMTEAYVELTGAEGDFAVVVAEAKRFVLARLFSGELDGLAHRAAEIAQRAVETRDVTEGAIREALTELLIAFPVYRSYVVTPPAQGADKELLEEVFETARGLCPQEAAAGLTFLYGLLVEGRFGGDRAAAELVLRLQQLTGPVMAKSLEDTAFYRYQRLISLNEVGGEPGIFGVSAEQLHAAMTRRQAAWPCALTAGSTHDTKFGEDFRARLNVLSEMPELWHETAGRWLADSEPLARPVEDEAAPESRMRFRFFQILVGAWPLDLQPGDREGLAAFRDRVQATMEKSIREAKERTRWTALDADYESAVADFVTAVFDPEQSPELLAQIHDFVQRLAVPGAVNSLAQTMLRLTLPGVPDVYQGSELWNLSLVDPDNRRPVDFARHAASLETCAGRGAADLLADWRSGVPKQCMIAGALSERLKRPDLFARGDCLPVEAEGSCAAHVFAFARVRGAQAALVVVPRLPFALLEDGQVPLPPAEAWGDARLVLPESLRGRTWHHASGPADVGIGDGMSVAQLLGDFPVAFLVTGEAA
jgi:(1->4)-alpha-D-glucan 1-alpha-D-glucosylmutase